METFTIILLILIASIIISYVVLPMISLNLKIRRLNKLGRARAGSRSIKEILAEIVFHDDETAKCQAELNQLLTIAYGSPDSPVSSPTIEPPKEAPKQVQIVFNSKEIACRYQGVDVPRYVKNANNEWYEYENLASYDEENRAIVDDASLNYITILDVPSKSVFLFRQLSSAPVLTKENNDELIESL